MCAHLGPPRSLTDIFTKRYCDLIKNWFFKISRLCLFIRKRGLLCISLLDLLDPKLTKNLKLGGYPMGRITMAVLCLRQFSSSFRDFPRNFQILPKESLLYICKVKFFDFEGSLLVQRKRLRPLVNSVWKAKAKFCCHPKIIFFLALKLAQF